MTDIQQTSTTTAPSKRGNPFQAIANVWNRGSKLVFSVYALIIATVVIHLIFGLGLIEAILIAMVIVVQAIMSLREVFFEEDEE